MVGNIANPLTFEDYCDIGVDFIRLGIGSGAACTTSANSSISRYQKKESYVSTT